MPRQFGVEVDLNAGKIGERAPCRIRPRYCDFKGRIYPVRVRTPRSRSTFDNAAEVVPTAVEVQSRRHMAVMGKLKRLPGIYAKFLEQCDDFRWIGLLPHESEVPARIATTSLCRYYFGLLIAMFGRFSVRFDGPRAKDDLFHRITRMRVPSTSAAPSVRRDLPEPDYALIQGWALLHVTPL